MSLEHLIERLQTSRTSSNQTQTLFQGLFEAAPDAILIVNSAGQVELANTQAEHLFGYSRAELQGRPIETLIPERFRDHHIQHRARYMQHSQTRPMGMGVELYAWLSACAWAATPTLALTPIIVQC